MRIGFPIRGQLICSLSLSYSFYEIPLHALLSLFGLSLYYYYDLLLLRFIIIIIVNIITAVVNIVCGLSKRGTFHFSFVSSCAVGDALIDILGPKERRLFMIEVFLIDRLPASSFCRFH